MPTKSALKKKVATKSTTAKKGAAKTTTRSKAVSGRAATAKATENKSASTGAKRAAAADQNAKAMATVVKMRSQEKPWSEIAESINSTPGKAQFLMMLHRVAEGEIDTISVNGSEEAVAKRINAARNKADDISSWGWLAARTGKSEGFIKGLLSEHGFYEPRASNVAQTRAERNGGGAAAKKSAAKPAAKKTTAKKATGKTAAKKKIAARKGRKDPS